MSYIPVTLTEKELRVLMDKAVAATKAVAVADLLLRDDLASEKLDETVMSALTKVARTSCEAAMVIMEISIKSVPEDNIEARVALDELKQAMAEVAASRFGEKKS